jgi:hypothetical protein
MNTTTSFMPTACPKRRGWLEISRRRAFLSHLGLSASIVGVVCAIIFLLWYPHPYFQATGTLNVLRVLIGVALVLGPLLTLIVFKPGKWGLKFDLVVIALVQLSALVYGITTIYRERPYFTVFALDRFYVLARDDVDAAKLAEPAIAARLGPKPAIGPLLVVAVRPTDTEGFQRLLDETVFGGQPDIEYRPEYWRNYADETAQVIARATPLSVLRAAQPAATRAIDNVVGRLGRPEGELGFLPFIARNRDMSFIVDTTTGALLEVLDVDPWGIPPAAQNPATPPADQLGN